MKTFIWGFRILTFIDEEPLKASLLLRGSTVLQMTWIKMGDKDYPGKAGRKRKSEFDASMSRNWKGKDYNPITGTQTQEFIRVMTFLGLDGENEKVS